METPATGKVRFPVYLDPPILMALRVRALEERTSATKIVERLIADHLRTAAPKRRRRKA